MQMRKKKVYQVAWISTPQSTSFNFGDDGEDKINDLWAIPLACLLLLPFLYNVIRRKILIPFLQNLHKIPCHEFED